MTPNPQSDDNDVERSVVETLNDRNEPKPLVGSMTAKHVAFGSWVVTAGFYGFMSAKWGNYAVDSGTATAYPEYGWVFLTFGLALGIAFSATIAAAERDHE